MAEEVLSSFRTVVAFGGEALEVARQVNCTYIISPWLRVAIDTIYTSIKPRERATRKELPWPLLEACCSL